MVTGDHSGFIKYWQTNMNNVKMFQGHKEPVRGIRWDSGCNRNVIMAVVLTIRIEAISVSLLLFIMASSDIWDFRTLAFYFKIFSIYLNFCKEIIENHVLKLIQFLSMTRTFGEAITWFWRTCYCSYLIKHSPMFTYLEMNEWQEFTWKLK